MQPAFKWLFIFGLILVSILASVFMILESGSFYQRLYPKDYGFFQLGFLAATLNEVFMAIMAGVWLPGKKKNGKEKGHPVNFFFRLLLILLFITTVGGASFNLVEEKISLLQNNAVNHEVIDVLRSQVNDNQESLSTFVQQKQRLNSVLTVRQQQETKERLILALKKQEPKQTLWVEIIFVILLRFGVQLANLSSVWLAGWLFRVPSLQREPKQKKRPESTEPPALPKHSLEVQPSLQVLPKPVRVQPQAVPSEAPQGIPQTAQSKPANRATPKAAQPKLQPLEQKQAPSRAAKSADPQKDLRPIYRKKLLTLLESTHEGTSLQQLALKLKVSKLFLEDLQNPRF